MASVKVNTSVLAILQKDDILFEIFKFMKLEDRKNARLVCQQWNKILNHAVFAQREMFCIPNWYNLDSVATVLKKCSRTRLNLYFTNHKFMLDNYVKSTYFWETVGHKIYSLSFTLCTISSEMLKLILSYCVNLREFSDYLSKPNHSLPNWPRLYVLRANILPPENSIVRESMKKLILHSNVPLSEKDLFKIAVMFPNLETFETHFQFEAAESFEYDAIKMTKLHTLTDKLKSIKSLKLTDEILAYSPECHKSDIDVNCGEGSNSSLTRLGNIEMILQNFTLQAEPLERILSHKFWTSLVLFEINLNPIISLTTIVRLLNELQSLEKFKMTSYSGEDFTAEIMSILFPTLVKSHLKSIELRGVANDLTSLNWDDNFVNLTVRQLRLYIYCYSENSVCCNVTTKLFLKHFQGLRELFAPSVAVNVGFSENQKNLEDVRIFTVVDQKTNESESSGSSDSVLYWKNLKISCFNSDWIIFYTHRFPNLKHLCFKNSICPNLTSPKECADEFKFLITKISLNCPNLISFEFVCGGSCFSNDVLNTQKMLKLFQQMKHLRYLHLYMDFTHVENDKALKRAMLKYFKQCPALRMVRLDSKVQTTKTFVGFLNIITKIVEFSSFTEDFPYYNFMPHWPTPYSHMT